MNTTRSLTHLTEVTAVVAAVLLLHAAPLQAAPKDAAAKTIIDLPRMVISGKRVQPMQVVDLPRVVVIGRRVDSAASSTRLVQSASGAAKPLLSVKPF